MANRFWVGGTGTWDGVDTTNWSASSGGAGGSSVPTTSDAVIFDASSGGGTCTIGAASVPCLTLNLTGYTGTLAFGSNKIQISGNSATVYTQTTSCSVSGTPLVELVYAGGAGTRTISSGGTTLTAANTPSISVTAGSDGFSLQSRVRALNFSGFSGTLIAGTNTVYSDLTFSAGMSITAGAQQFQLRNLTSSSTSTLTTNGKTIPRPLYQDSTGTWVLGDNLTVSATAGISVDAGTFNSNGKSVSTTVFATAGSVSRAINFGSSTWTVTGSGTAWSAAGSNMSNVVGTGTITMTSGSAKTFAGGGFSWPTLNQGGSGALTISGSNTFTNITNTVQPATITLTSGTTQTVSSFTASGTAGNLLTLNASTPGSAAKLSDASGINSVSYCSIKDITATGFATWQAYTSNGNVNGGNNVGWFFSVNPSKYIYSVRKAKRIIP